MRQLNEAIRIDVPAWPKNHTPDPKAEIKNLPVVVAPKILITEEDFKVSNQVTLPPNPPPGLTGRVEVPQVKKHSSANNNRLHFPKLVTTYAIARLVQFVNSRHHSGWTGSRAEREHCEAWNLKPLQVRV